MLTGLARRADHVGGRPRVKLIPVSATVENSSKNTSRLLTACGSSADDTEIQLPVIPPKKVGAALAAELVDPDVGRADHQLPAPDAVRRAHFDGRAATR